MKKRYWGIFCILCFVLLAGCSRESKEKREEVIWTISDFYGKIPESNVAALNEKLLEDGHDLKLFIDYVHIEENHVIGGPLVTETDFYSILSEKLAKGETDIATLEFQYEMRSEEIIAEGNLEELSSYLATEEGQYLKNSIYEEYWNATKIDGKLYMIPNEALTVASKHYYVFNKEYFTEEEVSFFHESWEDLVQLKELLESKEFPADVVPLCWRHNMAECANMVGYYNAEGVFISLETGMVKSPYEIEEYKTVLKTLHDLYQQGMLEEMETQQKREKRILEGKYGVWQSVEARMMLENLRETAWVEETPFYTGTLRDRNVAVCKNSPNKEKALQLLTLLHTNEEYVNLLIHGVEGIDYQMIDGLVYEMDGKARRAFYDSFQTGIYYNVYPDESSYFPRNRKELLDEFNNNYRLENVTMGFKRDTSNFDEQMNALSDVLSEQQYLWMEEDFESAWQAAEEAYMAAGAQRVIDELNRQWEEWLNK